MNATIELPEAEQLPLFWEWASYGLSGGEQLPLFAEYEPAWFTPSSGDFACLDCGVDTLAMGLAGFFGEYYLLTDPVWLEANPASTGMLCVGCVEARLGRRLAPADFTLSPVNVWPWKTPRLWSRISGSSRDSWTPSVRREARRHERLDLRAAEA